MRFFRLGPAKSEQGATLVEFAFTLPILAVIFYGIYDFGSALTLKQKLEAVVYETARAAASQSTDDLSSATVATAGSVSDLRDMAARSLQDAGVNDCGLMGSVPTSSNPATAVWVYSVSGGGCPAPLILTIRRQSILTVGGVSNVYSRVNMQYPFRYHAASLLKLVNPASTFSNNTNILVNTTMKNLL